MSDPELTDEEFMRRLRARFTERGGEGAEAAADNATVQEWRADPATRNFPEDAADEEMSYWDADE